MSSATNRTDGHSDYRGFPLKQVTWGYREQFRQLIDELYKRGIFGPGERHPRALCAPFLGQLPQAGYDYVLREYLAALAGPAGSLLRSPVLFRQWRRLGADFAQDRVYLGKRFFELWRAGELPVNPEQVELVLRWARSLRETDTDLAFSFLSGYPKISRRLDAGSLPEFIHNALQIHQRNPQTAADFLQMRIRSAEIYAQKLGRTCRLEDVRGRLTRLFRAVAGTGAELHHLSSLDSDDLIERGCGVVCGCGHLYLPDRVDVFKSHSLNRSWYLAATLLSAACYHFDSFPIAHGLEGRTTASAVLASGGSALARERGFMLQASELYRVLRATEGRYPGASGLLRRVAGAYSRHCAPAGPSEELLALCLGVAKVDQVDDRTRRLFRWVRDRAEIAESWSAMAEMLLHDPPRVQCRPAPPVSFFPDFEFPLQLSVAPSDAVVRDLSERARVGPPQPDSSAPVAARHEEKQEESEGGEGETRGEEGEDTEGTAAAAAYLYDEWNALEGEYYRDWCALREVRPAVRQASPIADEELRRQVESVRRLFQRLRPEAIEKEKYLASGDYIDIDSLIRFITRRKARRSPRVDFWVKHRLSRRDLATALLMDVSGSTGKEKGRRDIIEVEKAAAFTLGCGLQELGDRFGVFGFTGNGRQDCRFLVYKDLDDEWSDEAKARLMSARPGSSTRMGVALRHAGVKLAQTEARTRLVLVLTDGHPMDTGYDPDTGYAQSDVRKACEENRALGVHTFCIGTDPDAQDELEMQFPEGRYVVLREIGELPEALARSYLQITRC